VHPFGEACDDCGRAAEDTLARNRTKGKDKRETTSTAEQHGRLGFTVVFPLRSPSVRTSLFTMFSLLSYIVLGLGALRALAYDNSRSDNVRAIPSTSQRQIFTNEFNRLSLTTAKTVTVPHTALILPTVSAYSWSNR
jgi:hypothetical protein